MVTGTWWSVVRWMPVLGMMLVASGVAAQETESEGSSELEGSSEQGDELLQDGGLVLDPLAAVLTPEQIRTIGGSAHALDEEMLEQLTYTDPQQVLLQLPGVYVRQEDGYGLRPNIGLRGASSDRSKKVTLMEDGILFGPAPYSAPAAYYFPLMQRMTQVEVFKGPAAILFGPNTIGGSINLVSRGVPEDLELGVDGALGLDLFGRAHVYGGTRVGRFGFMLEGVHLGTTGFKELDGGGSTGFNRTELVGRVQLDLGGVMSAPQSLELRFGYSREHSDETYLGLTDEDFGANPWRRYRASARDEMDWDRTEVRLRHSVELGESTVVRTALYRHDLQRLWYRLNSIGQASLADVLSDPDGGRNAVFYDVLRGVSDSTATEVLNVAGNDRDFVSQGVQSEVETSMWTGVVEHNVRAGVRLHYDRIDRDHVNDEWQMVSGEMVRDAAVPSQTTTLNRGETTAFSAHGLWSMTVGRLTLAPGVRTELIATRFRDELVDAEATGNQRVVLPGLGAWLELTEELGLLAGAHQGFSPVAPGQNTDVRPERANNYEFGARYTREGNSTLAEVVGFVSDYSNLTGDCSFSSGCTEDQLDQQFNAGRALLSGVEVVLGSTPSLGSGLELPFRVAYTLTDARFRSAFVSDNPQFGDVEVGDRMPYLPPHQVFVQLGLQRYRWGVNLGLTVVDRMRETASRGAGEDVLFTDGYAMLDAQAEVEVVDGLRLYVRGENLTNAQPLASRFPFGARPGKPLIAQVGARWSM
jgi:Fe(3+) dicitrate transport protein